MGRFGIAAELAQHLPLHVRQVQIEEEVRPVFSSQVEPEPSLHCRHQLDGRPVGQDPFDELEVRQVVLDVQDRPGAAVPLAGDVEGLLELLQLRDRALRDRKLYPERGSFLASHRREEEPALRALLVGMLRQS